MIYLWSAEQVRRLLPPAALYRGRRRRQDAGRRPVLVCQECGGMGLIGPRRECADTQVCEECGGTGRVRRR